MLYSSEIHFLRIPNAETGLIRFCIRQGEGHFLEICLFEKKKPDEKVGDKFQMKSKN
jgi:hypothetical protein